MYGNESSATLGTKTCKIMTSAYFDNESLELNRQELEPAFSPNGAIVVLRYATFKSRKSFFTNNTFGYNMPIDNQ